MDGNTEHGTWKTGVCTEAERCALNVCVVPSFNSQRSLSI